MFLKHIFYVDIVLYFEIPFAIQRFDIRKLFQQIFFSSKCFLWNFTHTHTQTFWEQKNGGIKHHPIPCINTLISYLFERKCNILQFCTELDIRAKPKLLATYSKFRPIYCSLQLILVQIGLIVTLRYKPIMAWWIHSFMYSDNLNKLHGHWKPIECLGLVCFSIVFNQSLI